MRHEVVKNKSNSTRVIIKMFSNGEIINNHREMEVISLVRLMMSFQVGLVLFIQLLTLSVLNLERTHLTLQENCSCFALLN